MFQIIQKSSNRLDICITGKFDGDMMQAMINEFVDKSLLIERGLILYRINDIDMPTLKAIAVELSRVFELFAAIKKFERIAVLSDTAWIRYISEIEGIFIPGLKIKAFHQQDIDNAESWLGHAE